jgi:hypothetical protein
MKKNISAIIYLYLEWETSVAVNQPKDNQETTKSTIKKGMRVMGLVLPSTSIAQFTKLHSDTKSKKSTKKKSSSKQISKLARAQPIQVK